MLKYFVEIKNRFFLLAITWFSVLLISYVYKEVILFILIKISILDYNDNFHFLYFIFTGVTEIFSVFIRILLFFSFQFLFLFFIYHFFTFFSPALLKTEYFNIIILLKFFLYIWAFSIFLANFFIIPLSWNFFLSFQNFMTNKSFNLHFEAKLSEFIDFYISLSYLCIIYCNVLSFLLILIYFNSSGVKIKKFRKIYYYIFIVFATLISPPEIFSQLLLSLFTILVHESIILILLFKKNL